MSNGDDELLSRELGKIGELGGKLGGFLSGESALGKVAGPGGSLGARFAAAFLPTETYTEKVFLRIAPETALRYGYSTLAKLGKLQDEDHKPPYPFLKAVLGSGFLNMNPAVVYLEILEGDATQCEVTITAAAKEGLIKQHTAAKAVERVVAALKGIAA